MVFQPTMFLSQYLSWLSFFFQSEPNTLMVVVLDGIMRVRLERTGVHSTALMGHTRVILLTSNNSDRDDLGPFQRT